jgi:hypothetical protein
VPDSDAPLNVKRAGDKHQTVIDTASVHVGRTRAPTARGTRPGLDVVIHPEVSDQLPTGPQEATTDFTPHKGPDVNFDVGDKGSTGGITLRDVDDVATISLFGSSGTGAFGTGLKAGRILVRGDRGETTGPIVQIVGKTGRIEFIDDRARTVLVLDALTGDITFAGADCAEDFDVAEEVEPGTVLSIHDDGRLAPSRQAYDHRVAGVVSGAGELTPAMRLGRWAGDGQRVPVALVGRVLCLGDASERPIERGDLLTTSATPGHAMAARDRQQAFGAVLGKAMGALPAGRGLLPILVALQ